MIRKSQKQVTVRFLNRMLLFLTFFSLCMALFYVFGNMQSFLDETQYLILSILSVTSLSAVLIACILVIWEIFLFICKRWSIYLRMFFFTLVCLALSVFLVFISRIILFVAK